MRDIEETEAEAEADAIDEALKLQQDKIRMSQEKRKREQVEINEALKLQEENVRKSREKRKKDQDEADEALKLQEDQTITSLEKKKKELLDESTAELKDLERLEVERSVRKRKSIDPASDSIQSPGNQDNIKSPDTKVQKMGTRSQSVSSMMDTNVLLANSMVVDAEVEVPYKSQ